ncbi:uncharacterized protein LOC119876745 isoform X3 [Canis lupus familiaris]|uniref:uncharacterized protein LOC119876745 isoform X3 n=1 Tax=Canis lupus familiaris TaxID=9615 RepID=UPI0018F3A0AD|nr:uncharacterized protein LOC119876745 isoform X3 [Canis lupus familiaris]
MWSKGQQHLYRLLEVQYLKPHLRSIESESVVKQDPRLTRLTRVLMEKKKSITNLATPPPFAAGDRCLSETPKTPRRSRGRPGPRAPSRAPLRGRRGVPTATASRSPRLPSDEASAKTRSPDRRTGATEPTFINSYRPPPLLIFPACRRSGRYSSPSYGCDSEKLRRLPMATQHRSQAFSGFLGSQALLRRT